MREKKHDQWLAAYLYLYRNMLTDWLRTCTCAETCSVTGCVPVPVQKHAPWLATYLYLCRNMLTDWLRTCTCTETCSVTGYVPVQKTANCWLFQCWLQLIIQRLQAHICILNQSKHQPDSLTGQSIVDTPCSNNKNLLICGHNLCKCRSIFEVLLLTDSQENSPSICDRNFQLAFTMLLHYLGKFDAHILSTSLSSRIWLRHIGTINLL